MIGDPQYGAFVVWIEGEDASAGRTCGPASCAPHAAEMRAREDWLTGETQWPRTYVTRDEAAGTICVVDVTLALEPTFIAISSRDVPMDPSTHILWGGDVLCADLRLSGVPRDWPEGQRWISLKDVADGAPAPSDGCAKCWLAAPDLVSGIKQIGADR